LERANGSLASSFGGLRTLATAGFFAAIATGRGLAAGAAVASLAGSAGLGRGGITTDGAGSGSALAVAGTTGSAGFNGIIAGAAAGLAGKFTVDGTQFVAIPAAGSHVGMPLNCSNVGGVSGDDDMAATGVTGSGLGGSSTISPVMKSVASLVDVNSALRSQRMPEWGADSRSGIIVSEMPISTK
jgi:hypothetical protein